MSWQISLSDETARLAVIALCKAFRELNEIRARDGVPYTGSGYRSDVTYAYFSEVVDDCDKAVRALTGQAAHCHPALLERSEKSDV